MLIDCDSCAVRDLACGDCVVTVLLGAPPEGVDLDPADRRALEALADGGLIPRLRLVPGHPRQFGAQSDGQSEGSRQVGRADRRVG